MIYESKKDDSVFDHDGRADELDEMNNGRAFTDIELDEAALEVLFVQGGEQE